MKFPSLYQPVDLATIEKAEVLAFSVLHATGNQPIAHFSKIVGGADYAPLTLDALILITDAENVLDCLIADPDSAAGVISIYWDTQQTWLKPNCALPQNTVAFGQGQYTEMLGMRKALLQLELAVIDHGFIQSSQHQPGSGYFTQQVPNPWLQPYVRPYAHQQKDEGGLCMHPDVMDVQQQQYTASNQIR
ncbi:MAG: hypothetical protein [Bacteriophage sp.]|nr:MAG: hypothetical protein [Bacteriophage sp.]